MESVQHIQTFFVISSVGFIILGILATIFLCYSIYILHSFSKIMKKIDKEIGAIGGTTTEMLEEVRDSAVFRFVFQGKRKHKK